MAEQAPRVCYWRRGDNAFTGGVSFARIVGANVLVKPQRHILENGLGMAG